MIYVYIYFFSVTVPLLGNGKLGIGVKDLTDIILTVSMLKRPNGEFGPAEKVPPQFLFYLFFSNKLKILSFIFDFYFLPRFKKKYIYFLS